MRNIYGYAFLEGGELSQALQQFEVYARLIPNEPNPYDSLGEAYLAMGMPERAIEYLTRALTVDPDFYQSHNTRAVGLAMLGRLDEAVAEPSTEFTLRAFLLMRAGRFRDAASTLASGIKAPIENRSIVGEMSGHMMASLLALEQRRYPQALSAVESARRVLAQLPHPRQRVHLVLGELMSGLAETRAGRLERARAHLASQESLYNRASPFENAWHATLEGEIALAEKRPADAAASFDAASSSRAWISLYLDYPWALMSDIGARDGAARTAYARGDLKSAIELYRTLSATGPGQKRARMFDPRYVLELARLLEKSGDVKGALIEYERFLGYWKSADAELPELSEARRAIGRLRSM
jgi:tetratricopeptide (TPR) repeat protein